MRSVANTKTVSQFGQCLLQAKTKGLVDTHWFSFAGENEDPEKMIKVFRNLIRQKYIEEDFIVHGASCKYTKVCW